MVCLSFSVAQENINVEAEYILTRQGVINATEFVRKNQALALRPLEGDKAGFSAKYQDQYRELSDDMIEALRKMFQWEIFLFDYPDTPFVKFPKV